MECKEKRSERFESHCFLLPSFSWNLKLVKNPFLLEKFVDYFVLPVRVEGLPCSYGKVGERQFLTERALLIDVLVTTTTMKTVQVRHISVCWTRILCTWQKWAHILQPATEPCRADVLLQCLKTYRWKVKPFPRSPSHINNKAACYFQGIVTRSNFCGPMFLKKSKPPAEEIWLQRRKPAKLTVVMGSLRDFFMPKPATCKC